MEATQTLTPPALHALTGLLEDRDDFRAVVAALASGNAATIDGAWGSSCALAAAALAQQAPQGLVVVCPHAGDLDGFAGDFALFSERELWEFPAFESPGAKRLVEDEIFGRRLEVLKTLRSGNKQQSGWVLVTSIQSLLQPVVTPDILAAHTRKLTLGQQIDLEELLPWLVKFGFHRTSAVELPGEFSVRGGILDLFAPDWINPVRVELFDDEVESLRKFDSSSQRSIESLSEIELTGLSADDAAVKENKAHLADYLPPQTWFLVIEPADLEEEGRRYLDRLEHPQDQHRLKDVLQRTYTFPSVTAESISAGTLETSCHLKVESVERFSGEVAKACQELDAAAIGHEVHLVCQTEAEIHRLQSLFENSTLAASGRLHFCSGLLGTGFRLVRERIILLSGDELFRRHGVARPSRRRLGKVIDSFLDLREGDLVVHVSHGIARYLGLRLLEKEDQLEEHLELEFDAGVKVYVPTTRIELVQKYVGGSKHRPRLAKIGGKTWIRQKQRAQHAVQDLAAEMLEVQAQRGAQSGVSFPDDSEWQREFDAQFPYQETPDQLAAIASLKQDMRTPRPMDRLICGDVGYGKTEVAIRAAFKAVDAGYQVAVLVPTTVLCAQHVRTFRQRMSEYPFEIASLSRFNSRAEQHRTLERLAAGEVDLVVGTHRLAQKDVQFHNLGLLIIDEEQRFGVEIKERLKSFRATVDVLTLTATPIPRTLHMSLLGLRDISNLETPPEDRLAVETRVTRFDDDLIRNAVLRELNREGQIFFVHNRIHDIEMVAQRLRNIVPEARIGIGHGQMPEGHLEEIMARFVNHEFDLLLATTIVESGLDIPNANTIFIDEADCYGLADLHQLRGRVGRYKHRAYCYLLVDPHKSLTPTAAQRLRAIEEFSDMGAGFALSMRDLEIRGAGNILGTEQSGHIDAVGYELYCELLEQAVRKMKHMPAKMKIDVNIDLPGEAYLPRHYVADMRSKIDIYRRLARLGSEADLTDLHAELTDRFGPPPPPVLALIERMRLRMLAAIWQIDTVRIEDDYVVFEYLVRSRIDQLVTKSGRRLRVADFRSAYLPIQRPIQDPEKLISDLQSLLQ